MSKSPFLGHNYGQIIFLDTLQGQIRHGCHRPICLDAKSPKLLNLVKEIFFSRPLIVINVKITIFYQNHGLIYFLDTLQGQIRLRSHRPICLDVKSPKLHNLVKKIFFSRQIVLIDVKIILFWPKLWPYLFLGHPVWQNKAQQSQAYMFRCKKSQIAQPCKRKIFQQTNNID